ncbi:LOW QUALITY PROTEIN: hypothetical protein ACHAWX_005996 [Stephanocyclus meneghinianus]
MLTLRNCRLSINRPLNHQVQKWLGSLLCQMSHDSNLGFKTLITGSTINNRGQMHCYVYVLELLSNLHSPRTPLCTVKFLRTILHINMCYHYYMKHVHLGLIKILPVSMDNHIAGMLTKLLAQNAFCMH